MEDKTAELIGAIGCVFAQTENAEERSKMLQQIGEFIQALAGEERANQVKRYAERVRASEGPRANSARRFNRLARADS